ncbi:MAG: hypothetical protein IKS83_05105 [Victivallales bacterium]|nr:hypothetical protein [Victivallales bacterium]
MKNPLKLLLLFWALAIVASFQSLAAPKRLVEFEVKCPEGTEPHGICFAEYQGQEIIVCCVWELCSINIQCYQGYDLKGRLLQIPQEELEKCFGHILKGVKFERRYTLKTRELETKIAQRSVALLDKCIYPNGNCCSWADYHKELTLANAVWKVPFSHYTNFEKALDDLSPDTATYSTFDMAHATIPCGSKDSFSPVFTASNLTFQPYQFHIWGISGLDGKELAYYCSSKCGKGKEDFLPHCAILDSTLQHIAVLGNWNYPSNDAWQFYDSPGKFVEGENCFRYNLPKTQNSQFGEKSFFLSPDIFCFIRQGGTGTRGASIKKCYAVLYSFSENHIIADVELGHRLGYCGVWQSPWCTLSQDGKRLAIGFSRDLSKWVRVYQLAP